MKSKNITTDQFDLKMRDGLRLKFHYCQTEKPTLLLLFLPGFEGDFNQYKRLFYAFLQVNEAAIFCMTIRGESHNKKGIFHVDHDDQLFNDTQDLFLHMQLNYPNIPVYVCAHSGGSSLAVRLTTSDLSQQVAGLFLIEPVFPGDMEIDREPTPFIYTLNHFANQWKIASLPEKPMIENKWDYRFSIIRYFIGEAIPFFNRFVVLKVREKKDLPWKRYTGTYQRSYACSYHQLELKKRLKQLHCPVWMAVGENDEYTLPQAMISVVNWNVSPEYLRDVYQVNKVTHFGSLAVAASLLTRWLRQEAERNLSEIEVKEEVPA